MSKLIYNNTLIYITFQERSKQLFAVELAAVLKEKFGTGTFDEEAKTNEILKFAYDWTADRFVQVMHEETDKAFFYYLFNVHEDSIQLYYKTLTSREDVQKNGVDINTLSLNRRILKLALEQSCDIDYVGKKETNLATVQGFIRRVEDLMYLGDQLYGYAEFMAEQRMMEDPIEIIISDNTLTVQRKHHYDQVYTAMQDFFVEGFRKGFIDEEVIKELRGVLKNCMGIDYDFAGGQIQQIKEHFSPKSPRMQTVQHHVLAENLIRSGMDKVEANRFYDGLTLRRENKLNIKDSVYKSSSMLRYMFRPLLVVNIEGDERTLVGEEKWKESISVMATNGFQWQQAPEEWKQNPCFNDYLNKKSNEHDFLLEKATMEVLDKRNLPYIHHVVSLKLLNGPAVRVDKDPGEMDFIIIDPASKKVLVTDCKYHRARYEMVGFSNDYRNFKQEYEKKIAKKVKFIAANLKLVQEHFEGEGKIKGLDISGFDVEALFIINTPTFYMFNGSYNAITVSHLDEFITGGYRFPEIVIKPHEPYQPEKKINHPYFTIQ
jgi:hypothetical protein